MSLRRVKAADLKPGDRMFIGIGEGGAVIKAVYPIGDAAVPEQVRLVFDSPYDNKRVIPVWNASENLAVYPTPDAINWQLDAPKFRSLPDWAKFKGSEFVTRM